MLVPEVLNTFEETGLIDARRVGPASEEIFLLFDNSFFAHSRCLKRLREAYKDGPILQTAESSR